MTEGSQMNYYDAHSHLHFSELEGLDLSDYFERVSGVVVNGTTPEDWAKVSALYEAYPEQVIPAFGVHPWRVKELQGGWEKELRALLQAYPNSGVGEVGLDKWVRGHDLEVQKRVFLAQLEIAGEEERPLSIHCLKAWGHMRDMMDEHKGLRFLLHAYNGPREFLGDFIESGAYFSLSPYFFHERKTETLALYREVPLERLLIETDAPAMLGPPSCWSTAQEEFSKEHQHPANLFSVYAEAARFIGLDVETMAAQIEGNFRRLFS